MQSVHPFLQSKNQSVDSENQSVDSENQENQYDFKSNDQKDRQYVEQRSRKPAKLNFSRSKNRKMALIGWNLASIEAAKKLNRAFVVVSLPEFEDYANQHQIPFISWDFNRKHPYEEIYNLSKKLYDQLKVLEVDHAIPLFEETVEWAGALNAHFRNDPRIFDHSLLFRDKAMMKRRAHMGGLRVGVFEEAKNKDDVRQFFRRINHALLRSHDENPEHIHVKALDKAGASGHRMICFESDIDQKLDDDHFPCLVESHLAGIEVSCEAFIYDGNVKFMNITEYIVFGYSMMVPPSPEIEQYRDSIRKEVQKIVDVFHIQYGIIHPEFFIAEDGQLYFGEVAYRIPGGHIFDLMQKTYEFSPFEGHILCSDPNTEEDELNNFFPDEKTHNGYAGSFLVYPRVNYINGTNIPDELEQHPAFERHTIFTPDDRNVQQMEGYGNHYGTIFFYNDDCEQVKQPLQHYVEHDFYV